MVLISSFKIQFDSNEMANKAYSIVLDVIKNKGEMSKLLKQDNSSLIVEEDSLLTNEEYNGCLKNIVETLVENNKDMNVFVKGEFYSDNKEIYEAIVLRNHYYQRYIKEEDYNEGTNETKNFFAIIRSNVINEEYIEEGSLDLDDILCKECGEYIVKHYDYPLSFCPYCHHIESEDIVFEEVVLSKWEEYKFEIPLGVTLPKIIVSSGADWHSDCEQDDVFGLNPACYESLNQYNAALRLCKSCAGWFYYGNEDERNKSIECYREILKSKQGEPMWYYDVYQNTFRWMDALRECNLTYKGKLLNVENIWDLFYKLDQRSIIEKADVFEWFVDFFGDYLKYEGRYKLSDTYLQNYYDNHIETILYLREHQIDILTKSSAKVSSNSIIPLSRASAGLIRMGKKELGLSLYKRVFAFAWGTDTSVEDKKNVVDQFIERLAMGYENEQYIDDDIAALLERQCSKYSDGAWSSKIRMSLGRNK